MSFAKLVQKVKSEIAFYKGLAKDTEGASGIEYAIVAAMVAVVLAGYGSDLGDKITEVLDGLKNSL